ncbi:MAG: DUF362 domain-containing protein [Candidatus Bathyarchaeia archaeon]
MAVKVGIVGCGRIATAVHLPLLRRNSAVKVTAAVDIDTIRLHETMERFRIEEGYADYRSMLERADIDAVFVCTPPETHSQIVMDSLNHGKHVFCERPLATTLKEGLAIKRALETKRRKVSSHLVLMPAHNFIFTPCFVHALQLVKDGEIGSLQRIQGYAASNLRFYGAKTDFRVHAKGGVIEDQLPHVLYLCHEVRGRLERVLSIESHRRGHTVVDGVNVEARLRGGVTASLSARWTSLLDGFLPTLKFDMTGDSGQIRMDLLRTPYNVTILKDREGVKTIHMGRRLRQHLDVLRWKHPSYAEEHAHFLRCVEGKETVRVTVDDAIELVRTLNEVMTLFEKSPYSATGREKAVVLRAGEDVESTIRKSIDLLGGLSVKRDDLVVIKPNVCYPKNVENMIITDPRVLEAVINIAKNKTKNVVVVESDSVSGTANSRATKSGVMGLIKKCDVEFLNLSEDEVEEHEVAGFTLQVPKTVMKADFLINVPKVKTHDIVSISIAMKNMFGALANKKKFKFHSRLADVLVFLNRTIRQDLIIVDGIVGMEGLGPIQGSPVDLGLIISGLNPVTVDAVCCHIMDFNPYAIETLWRAYKAGVGEIDIGRIQVLGEKINDVKKRFSHPTRSPKNIFTALKMRLKAYLRG